MAQALWYRPLAYEQARKSDAMSATSELVMYFTPTDAAIRLGMSAMGVRNLVVSGGLRQAATTPRGLHLFLPEEVERVRRERSRRRR